MCELLLSPLFECLELGRSHKTLLVSEKPQLFLDPADAPPGPPDAPLKPVPTPRSVSILHMGPSSQDFQSQGGGAAAPGQKPVLPAALDIIFPALSVCPVKGGPESL